MEPHIADFGIAELLDQSSASSLSVIVAGTTGYIAPEKFSRIIVDWPISFIISIK